MLFDYEGSAILCKDPDVLPENDYTMFDDEAGTAITGGRDYVASLVNHQGEPFNNATISRRKGGKICISVNTEADIRSRY